MKISHFTSISNTRASGVSTAVDALSQGQSELGHYVKCFYSVHYLQNHSTLHKGGVQNFYLEQSKFNLIKIIKAYKILLTEIKKIRPHIIHIHSVYSINNFFVSSIARRLNIPYVISPHGGYAPNIRKRRGMRKRIFEFIFEHNLLKNAKLIFAVSDIELMFLKKLSWSLPEMIQIHNPLPNEFKFIEENVGFKPRTEYYKFIYLGRLDIVHKGIDLFIRALSILPYEIQRKIEIKFISPTNRKIIIKINKMILDLKIKAKISFCGTKIGNEKIQILKDSHLLFLTSRWEVFGYSVIEAILAGIPVLVTNCIPISNILANNSCGFTCEARAKSIYEQLRKFIAKSPEEILAQTTKAIKIIKREFDTLQISKKVCNAYKQVIVSRLQ